MSILDQLKRVLSNPSVSSIKGGQRIDAKLPNGEAVHIMKFDDSPAWYVAIGDIPEYGSPPMSQSEAAALVLRAAK